MLDLVLIQKAGNLRLNSKQPLRIITKAEHKQALLSEDVINISLESREPLDFFLGDRIEYANRYFTLNQAPKVKREQGFYAYDLVFEGVQYRLRNKIYFNLDKTDFQTTADFPLTGEIDIFLKVLIDNINKIDDFRWILGEYPQGTETKTLTFNGENCLGALQNICKEYSTEFEILEDLALKTCTLNIKEIGRKTAFAFEYGKGGGLYSLTRHNEADDVITRLYAYGSTDNIPNDYRDWSDRLRMPENQGDYIQDDEKVRLFGLKEGIKNFDDIKPTFKGVVSQVLAFDEKTQTQELVVENMDFDLNEKDDKGNTKWLLHDTPVKLAFTKGNLAGYEFELLKKGGYNHAMKLFKVRQFEDERGQKFPDIGTIFEFAVGDEFTLIDLVMPDEYLTRAENKLLEEAQKEYDKVSRNNLKYTLDLDPFYLKERGREDIAFFLIGDFVRIKDEFLGIDKESRVISISRDLLNPYDYRLDIADTYEINFTVALLQDIADTKKIVKNDLQISKKTALRGARATEDLKNMVFDTDGYFNSENIKPLSIETNMLSVGSRSQQLSTTLILEPNFGTAPNRVKAKESKIYSQTFDREWEVEPLDITLTDNEPKYVYARAGRLVDRAVLELSDEQKAFDSDEVDFYFLLGILTGVESDERIFVPTYGSTTITGGMIRTGAISSNDGRTTFDLNKGEISGHINFRSGITTGTMMVGNDYGTNAGITGNEDLTNIFLWGGGTYEDMLMGRARRELRRNAVDIWRHPNGQVGFEIGIIDNRLVLNGYHETGTKLFELDPNRGLVNVVYIRESWTQQGIYRFVYANSSFDENVIREELKRVIKREDNIEYDDIVFSDDGTGIPKHNYDRKITDSFTVTTIFTLYSNFVAYEYNVGTHPDNAKYENFQGYKVKDKSRTDNTPNGWYCLKTGEVYRAYKRNDYSHQFIKYNFSVYLYYIQDGKITQSKVITMEM